MSYSRKSCNTDICELPFCAVLKTMKIDKKKNVLKQDLKLN